MEPPRAASSRNSSNPSCKCAPSLKARCKPVLTYNVSVAEQRLQTPQWVSYPRPRPICKRGAVGLLAMWVCNRVCNTHIRKHITTPADCFTAMLWNIEIARTRARKKVQAHCIPSHKPGESPCMPQTRSRSPTALLYETCARQQHAARSQTIQTERTPASHRPQRQVQKGVALARQRTQLPARSTTQAVRSNPGEKHTLRKMEAHAQ